MKILFTIPTLFEQPNHTFECVESLRQNLKNFDVDYRICIVINSMSKDFEKADFGPGTVKLCSNLEFNIAKALNTAIETSSDCDYFCYVDEGMFITNTLWINYLIELFEKNPSIGLVGCRPHSTFSKYSKNISDDPEIYEVLWSDGILFTTFKSIAEVGGFDESYFGDCELQDFGYKLHFAGYRNLFWKDLSKHRTVPFTNKSSRPKELLDLVAKSRQIFKERWNDKEFNNFKFKSFS